MVKALIGLGNPGAAYEGNRHNVGFMALDVIADALKAGDFKKKFSGLLAEASHAGEKIYLFKPQTYMNRSGQPVSELANFYKIPVEDIIVFYDELDLPLGKLRIKQGGGSGGHNGIKSLDECVGSNYWRVRLGIGHPGVKEIVTSHVLDDFSKDEKPLVNQMLAAIAEHIQLLINNDSAAFTNKIALVVKPASA